MSNYIPLCNVHIITNPCRNPDADLARPQLSVFAQATVFGNELLACYAVCHAVSWTNSFVAIQFLIIRFIHAFAHTEIEQLISYHDV